MEYTRKHEQQSVVEEEEEEALKAILVNDSYLLPKLKELHKSENYIGYPTNLLLKLVDDFIQRSTGPIEQGSKDALSECGKGTYANKLPNVLGRLFSQITTEILNGNDTHRITVNVLTNHLAKFYWKDKAAITLAAFALTFADFWLLVRIYADNVVNEPMTTDSRTSRNNKEAYRNQIEYNNEFIKILFKSLRYLFDVINSRFGYVDMSDDRQAICVYWIVRCAIVLATQIIILSSKGLDQYLVGIGIPIEVQKLILLSDELMCTLSKSPKRERALETINTKLSNEVDIVGFMRVLITDDEDMPPLFHGETKRKDNLDVLRGKRVLLLISGIDILPEDIASLKRVTIDTQVDEIVWIPVIDRSIAELARAKFLLEALQNFMSWYSVQPSMVLDDAIYFFELKWSFKGTPIFVLLSPNGKVLRYDAIHMVRIWQNLSIDNLISCGVERQLWEKETWNLNLLVNDIFIDPIMQKWIQDERYIILYGCNDIEWIRRFTREAQSVASDLQARIEMVYVGNRENEDRGRRVRSVILVEQLSHCLPAESNMAYFWTRFDSMLESKRRFASKENPLLQEMLRFHSYREWALLARGSTILVNGPGQIVLNALKILRDGRQSCYFGGI